MRFVMILLTAGFMFACASGPDASWSEQELKKECRVLCEEEKASLCQFNSSNLNELQQCLDDPQWCIRDCDKVLYN